MPAFPSLAFFEAAVDAFNADPDAAGAAEGWTWDFGVVVDTEGGTVAVYVAAPSDGRLPRPELLALSELEDREPAWFARADEATWRALMQGGLDPIAALVQKRLAVKGDLTQVVERLRYKGLATRWLDRIRSGGL